MGECKTAVIDLDSILYVCGFGNKIYLGEDELGNSIFERDDKDRLLYIDKTEEEISTCLDNIMIDILNNTEATGYIAFVKGKNTGAHRYASKPDYKANRPKESPSWWKYTKQYAIDAWNAIEVNDIEVDDAVNIARLNIENSFIVAIDKDLLNLQGTHYNWKKQEWSSLDEIMADYSLAFDLITGQSGDGISGLPKYGKVNAAKILNDESTSDSFFIKSFKEYIKVFGEDLGIKEFYKNYNCLKILDNYEGFVIPEITKYNKQDKLINELEKLLYGGTREEES